MTIVQPTITSVRDMAVIHQASFEGGWSAQALEQLMRAAGVFALSDWPMTGFIMVRVVADEGEVLTVAVAASGRRRGLGRRLLRDAQVRTAEAGGQTLFLEVASDNVPALDLYRSEGFKEAGRRRRYYSRPTGGDVDALILKKALTAAT